jgi:hypothetical protein
MWKVSTTADSECSYSLRVWRWPKTLRSQVLTFYGISHKSRFLIGVEATLKRQTGNAYKILFWRDLEVEYTILTFGDPCIIVKFIKKNPTRCNSVSNFIIPYLYEVQHVSGDTPPIIRSLKLHWRPLFFIRGRLFVHVVGGRCRAQCA